MEIKKILVMVDESSSSASRLETGFNLAKNMDASITALCVVPSYSPTVGVGTMHGGWYIGEEVVENQRRNALAAAKKVRTRCEKLSKQYGTKLDWVQEEGNVVHTTCNEIQYHDVLLLGKPNSIDEPQLHLDELNNIILSCGKPVLVLPDTTPFFVKLPENILVAWDRSREAVQAVHYSMPFLKAATSVMVMSAYVHKERRKTLQLQADDMGAYLEHHDVNASSHALPKQHRSTGALIVNYAEESEVDLIVMGAYGHSRLRELVIGGATRHMLQHATLPVLFAH